MNHIGRRFLPSHLVPDSELVEPWIRGRVIRLLRLKCTKKMKHNLMHRVEDRVEMDLYRMLIK